MVQKKQNQIESVFMSLAEACAYLNLKPATLYSYNYYRTIPFHRRRGRKVYYKKVDLDNFILNNTSLVKSYLQIESEAISNIIAGK